MKYSIIIILLFLTIISITVSTDLGNECEIQGEYLTTTTTTNNKLKVIITGTTLTFQDGELILPGFFNVSSTSNPVTTLTTYSKFISNGNYIIISPTICFSISLIEYKELKIYKPVKNENNNCDTYITDGEKDSTDNTIFDGELIEGTSTFCSYFILGALVASIGSFCATLGMNLQKLTHDKLEQQKDRTSNYYTQPLWIIGMSLIVLDGILDVLTFGMAPAAMLAPLASLVLVHNVIIAPCLLKEKLDKKSLIATVIIISGSLLATVFAPKKTPILSPDYFFQRWTSLGMIIFESCVVVIFFTFYFYVTSIVKRRTVTKSCLDVNVELLRKMSNKEKDFSSIDDAIDDAINTKDIQLIASKSSSSNSNDDGKEEETYEDLELVEGEYDYTVVRFGYSFLSGLLGGQSIIFAKTVIELVKVTFFGKNQGIDYMCFANIDFYVYLIAMILVLVAQTNILNLGLKYFEALKIVPVFITFYQIFGVIGGGLYYKEFDEFTTANWILFPVGCIVSFCGIYILSMKPGSLFKDGNNNDDDDTDNLNDDGTSNDRVDRLSRHFRTSVHLPLLRKDDSESIEISKGRKSINSKLRWSLTSDDILLINKQSSNGNNVDGNNRKSQVRSSLSAKSRTISDPTGISISQINKEKQESGP